MVVGDGVIQPGTVSEPDKVRVRYYNNRNVAWHLAGMRLRRTPMIKLSMPRARREMYQITACTAWGASPGKTRPLMLSLVSSRLRP